MGLPAGERKIEPNRRFSSTENLTKLIVCGSSQQFAITVNAINLKTNKLSLGNKRC